MKMLRDISLIPVALILVVVCYIYFSENKIMRCNAFSYAIVDGLIFKGDSVIPCKDYKKRVINDRK